MQKELPRPFGRYTLLKSLRRGAMGEAFLAASGEGDDAGLCVVKMGLPELPPDLAVRFSDEARVMRRLSSANIARVFDAGEVNGVRFLAMEYVEGWSLEEVFTFMEAAGLSMPVPIAIFIARELARGLHHAHASADLKIIHRDVAPANVMLAVDGQVKLIDFGLARSTMRKGLTVPGALLGHVGYFAPERLSGDYDHRSDLYSLGVILWEMLAGQPLFAWGAGNSPAPPPARAAPPPPSTKRGELDHLLDAIVLRALAAAPDDRFQDGESLRVALGECLVRSAATTDYGTVSAFLHQAVGDAVIEALHRDRERLLNTVRSQTRVPSAGTSDPTKQVGGPHVGSVLVGKYRIDRLCGTGGLGRVYEGKHVEIGRRVAVKILKPEFQSSPEILERFAREAQLASRADSENIVQVTDTGTTLDGCPFLVMEYLEGETLRQLLDRERTLPVDRAVAIAVEIAHGLESAHAAGVVHRDLKPSNVMLLPGEYDRARPHLKLLDFGVSKSLLPAKSDGAAQPLTRPLTPVGTPEYMAPEQAMGLPADFRADVYALGGVLFEMLTGRPPFDEDSPLAIMTAKQEREAPRISAAQPEVDRQLDDLVARALSREKDHRQQSMTELRASLEQLNDRLKLRPLSSSAVPGRRQSPERTLDVRSRRPWLVASLGAAVAVALAVVAGARSTRQPAPSRSVPEPIAATSPPPARLEPSTPERPAADQPKPVLEAPTIDPIEAPPAIGPATTPRRRSEEREARSARAVATDVRRSNVRDTKGSSLAKSAALALEQRRYVDAIELSDESLDAGHDDIRTRLTLGTANLMLGRTREAKRHFQAAARMDPTNEEAAQGLAATAKSE